MKQIWLIAKTVLIEAIRRKEIYVIVLLAVSVIGITGTIRFFDLEGMSKFYREVSLKIMNVATALTVIVLAARQLPREFESRNIHSLLAKPIGRSAYLFGKYIGVLLAGGFCYLLFVLLFLAGMKYLDATINMGVLLQAVYLQVLALSILASMSFMLSLLLNVDAAVTVGVLMYLLGGALSSAIDLVYESFKRFVPFTAPWGGDTSLGALFIQALNFSIPQLSLFDLSSKVVHAEKWGTVAGWAIFQLTLYASVFTLVFFGLAYWLFRRREL